MKKIYAIPAATAAALMLSLTSVSASQVNELPLAAQAPVYHDIVFESGEGGTFAGGKTQIVESLSSDDMFRNQPFPALEVKAGYRFIGWSMDGGVPRPEKYYGFMVPTTGHVFAAVYERLSFTLTLEAGEHGTLDDADRILSVEAGKVLGSLPVPAVNEGYIFDGWLIDGILFTPEQAAEYVMPAGDLTLTAKYSRKPVSLEVSAGEYGKLEDGKESQIFDNIPFGSVIKPADLPKVEANEGYVFEGWTANGTDLIGEDGIELDQNMTLTAVYKKDESANHPNESNPAEKPGDAEESAKPENGKPGQNAGNESIKDENKTDNKEESRKPVTSSSVQTSAASGMTGALVGTTGSMAAMVAAAVLRRKKK